MTEQLHRRIVESLQDQFAGSEHVAASQLSNAPMPEGIRHFLVRSLERRIHLETRSALESMNDWVDGEYGAVDEIAGQVVDTILEAARYPGKEWDRACAPAVAALTAYLQEPARALAEFAYPTGTTSVPANDLRRRTGYFADYPYMSRAVDAWLEQRDTDRVDRSAFESAMRHLDVRMTEDHGVDEWMALLQPMIDLVTYARIEPAGLPVPMVIRFFEAKDRQALAALIHQAASVHGAEMITVPSLRQIIEKGLQNERLRREQAAAVPAQAPPVQESPKAPAAEDAESAPEDSPDQPLPLWKRFQQKADHEAASGQSSQRTSEAQPLWKSFESPAQQPTGQPAEPPSERHSEPSFDQPATRPQEASPAPNPEPARRPDPELPVQEAPRLESQHIVLGTAVRSRERFIRALFGNDESVYRDVMDDLAEAPDWSSASSIIADRVFKPYRIDIYSDVAVDFTNAVEARYSGMPS